MSNLVITYFGKAYEKEMVSFVSEMMVKTRKGQDFTACPILLTPEYLTSSLENVIKFLELAEDERTVELKPAQLTYEKVLKFKKPDPFFTDYQSELNFYERLVFNSDLVLIDASLLDSAMGQWFIQASDAPQVWALGEGVHNSPIASRYIKGLIYPKNKNEFLALFDMVNSLNEMKYA